MGFKFNVGDKVKIEVSGETGHVRGRAEYVASENSYFVLYQTADGRAVEVWWPESTLMAAD